MTNLKKCDIIKIIEKEVNLRIRILKADERHRKDINCLIVSAKIGSSIRGPIRNFWIVRMHNKIVACAGLDFFGNEAAILTYLVVEKEFRHQGIGSALIQHEIDLARKHGASLLALAAMYYHFNFYKRRGFKTCPRKDLPGSVKGYWMFTIQRYKKCAVMIRSL